MRSSLVVVGLVALVLLVGLMVSITRPTVPTVSGPPSSQSSTTRFPPSRVSGPPSPDPVYRRVGWRGPGIPAFPKPATTAGQDIVRNATPSQRAAQKECLSHVKLLSLAALMYCQDHDEKMAPAPQWTSKVYPYLTHLSRDDPYAPLRCPNASQLTVGYAYNEVISFRSLSSIGAPAKTVTLADSKMGGRNPVARLTGSRLIKRHHGGSNVAFIDGHVTWMQAR